MKNASGAITRPPARNWISLAKTASKSRSVLAVRTWSRRPRAWAAACTLLVFASVRALVGLTRSTMTLAVGTNSYRRKSVDGGNHSHLTVNQIDRKSRQSIVLTLCPSIFDCDILPLDVAGFRQASVKGGDCVT